MPLFDVNILIYAYRAESQNHEAHKSWLEDVINSDELYGVPDVVLSGFLRIVTNHRAFKTPTPIDEAVEFVEKLRNQPNCIVVYPGNRHWQIFLDFCVAVNAKGNTVPDAYLAALAIESGHEWITADRGFARFPGLKWRHPLD